MDGLLNRLLSGLVSVCENALIILCRKPKPKNGYIDVGDGCWRPNVLVTSLRCW